MASALSAVEPEGCIGSALTCGLSIRRKRPSARPYPRPRRRWLDNHLALQIIGRHLVVIDDADATHSCRSQVHDERRAKSACPDHKHTGRLQPLLALPANLFHKEVPFVPVDFIG